MRKVGIEQSTTITYVADATTPADLERVGLLTRIEVTVQITPSATLRGAVQPDGLFRIIQNLRIVGGSHVYYALPSLDGGQGGTLLHYLNMLDGYGPGHIDAAIVAPNRTFTPVTWVLHAGTRPFIGTTPNPFDLTAFIPAEKESQLRAEWVTSGNDVLDDTVTITAATTTMLFTLYRVIGTEEELKLEMARQRVNLPTNEPGAPPYVGMVPAWTTTIDSPTAVAADFSRLIDVPTGAFLKRIGILTQDATADRPLRAGDELTDLELVLDNNERVFRFGIEHLNGKIPYASVVVPDAGLTMANTTTARSQADFSNHSPTGVFGVDLRPYGISPVSRDYGIDLRGYQSGNWRLGLTLTTNAAGDDSLILWERYVPYSGPLA